MRQRVVWVSGYDEAILGAMLSYGKTSFDKFTANSEDKERLAKKLAPIDGGHNKFLEQIQYWVLIEAPLFWWKQFDTYRVGISKSSESTMHKSWKNGLTQEMFEYPILGSTLTALNDAIREYQGPITQKERKQFLESFIINNLPDGYLQTRMVNINAKSLRNIYFQRRDHKLKQWRDFCRKIQEYPYGYLIVDA